MTKYALEYPTKSAFITHIGTLSIADSRCTALYCDFNLAHYNDLLFEQLQVRFCEHIARAIDKRKAEYLAGRLLAQTGIHAYTGQQQHIPTGEKREPLWPRDIVGSISHTHNKAVCLVSDNTDLLLGLDIEQQLSTKTANNVHASIVQPSEMTVLEQGDNRLPFTTLITIAFSAKESLFKALYPLVGRYFGFDAAHILAINPSTGTLDIALTETLSDSVNEGDRFRLHYVLNSDDTVLTYLIQERHDVIKQFE